MMFPPAPLYGNGYTKRQSPPAGDHNLRPGWLNKSLIPCCLKKCFGDWIAGSRPSRRGRNVNGAAVFGGIVANLLTTFITDFARVARMKQRALIGWDCVPR
jgi:hypothetical protein